MTTQQEAASTTAQGAFGWRFVTPLFMGSALNPVNSSLIATALVPIAAAMGVSVGRTAVLVSALYLASSIAQPTAGKLAEEFGPRVAGLVAAVTNPEYAPDRDADEQYREHVAQSLRDDPWARVIKASDFTDNGVGLIHTAGPRQHKLAAKYAPLVPVLQELIALPDTPLDAPARQRILAQLSQAADRFAAILPAGG